MKVTRRRANTAIVYHWQDLYRQRFNSFERIRKLKLWQVLCQEYLQKFIRHKDTVLDLGAGSCEFINSIKCREKIAIDGNRQLLKVAKKDVKVIVGDITFTSFFATLSSCLFPSMAIFSRHLIEFINSHEPAPKSKTVSLCLTNFCKYSWHNTCHSLSFLILSKLLNLCRYKSCQ